MHHVCTCSAVKMIGQKGRKVTVKYDNGEQEDVAQDHVQSNELPIDFGEEAIPLQVRQQSAVQEQLLTM
jgi:hypothetical protein